MTELSQIAPAFVAMAHRMVWASAATVDARGRPRSRILHPIRQWGGERLLGWIATSPSPYLFRLKRSYSSANANTRSQPAP